MSPETHSHNKKPDISKSGFFLPAVQAALCQALSLVILYGLLHMAWWAAGWQATLGMAAIGQGTLAAALSYWRRLPSWWLGIQFVFPMALLMAISAGVPPSLFLLAFVLLLLVYWTPFKTRVPLYISNRRVWEKITQLLPRNQDIRFLDIGSGLGGLVIHLAKNCPSASIVGIELAPLPWLFSWLRGHFLRSRAKILFGNYDKLDFSRFDVVFAYLSPAAMRSLWEKACSEMRPGTLVLSYEFIIPGVPPDLHIGVGEGRPTLFGWYIQGISRKQDSSLQFPKDQAI